MYNYCINIGFSNINIADSPDLMLVGKQDKQYTKRNSRWLLLRTIVFDVAVTVDHCRWRYGIRTFAG